MSRLPSSLLLSFAAVLMAVQAHSDRAQAESIEDVLSTAYNSNPSLMAARAALRSADEQVPQALAGWRPQVSLTSDAGRGRYFNNFSPLIPDLTDRSVLDYSVVVTQPLYSGGRTVAQTAQAEGAVQSQRAQLSAVENQVLVQAATAFLDVTRDEAILKLNINNEQVFGRDLDQARSRYKVGEITSTDVAQAEARYAQAQAERLGAEGTLQTSRANFVAVIGRPAESPENPKQIPLIPGGLDHLQVLAQDQNPTVQSAAWAAQSAKDAIRAVEGELLPTLALQGSYGRNINDFLEGAETRTASGLLTLSIPIYEGGAVYARVRAQKQLWGQRLIEVDKAKRDAVLSLTQGWETAFSAHARVTSYLSQIAANELALKGVSEEAKVGARTVIEVLNAEQELFTAKVNEVVARHDEAVAIYQMRAALGQMTAQAFGLPVELYDPAHHYSEIHDLWLGLGE